ncbi:MAG: FAD-dependent oxidoreductase [Deltaproteobacteria bacterium]|nr:FAD-dependent oxidoreductase [Deltaproteobacteria bacterium]
MRDTIVVGGGLSGLMAATWLARAGRKVKVLERSVRWGGRGITERQGGFSTNLGPHALYGGGPAMRWLKNVGLHFRAPKVAPDRSYFVDQQQLHAIPSGPISLLSHGGLSFSEKWGLARALERVLLADPAAHAEGTVAEWLDDAVRPSLRSWLSALFRVSTYCEWPERQSAEAGLSQLHQVLRHGVHYVDGGWQTLVDGLAHAAKTAGAELLSSSSVRAIHTDHRVREVELEDGTLLPAEALILAVDPGTVHKLLRGPGQAVAAQWAAHSTPVKAATLDVQLRRLPRPELKSVFGLDRPSYFAVHSETAQLAPSGGALIHVARYLRPDQEGLVDAATLEQELDLLQPGWREVRVEQRFLPKLVVSHRAVRADQGGLSGRPEVDGLGISGLWVAGDWVGPEGMLLDAALASARGAVEQLLEVTSSALAA